MIAFLLLLFTVSCAYQVAAAVLFWKFSKETSRATPPPSYPSYSQIKPLHQVTSQTLSAIETFCSEDGAIKGPLYLCSPQKAPQEWVKNHKNVTWLQLDSDQSQNGKASILAKGERYWSGDVFVISDADMLAPSGYLQAVLAPFSDPKVGVVTCIYRSTSATFGAWGHLFESLCILDFAVSVLVARQTEGISFAMGSTMAIRRQTLEEIGGFKALTPYLADDFQLGNRAHQLGWQVHLAPTILETAPGKGGLNHALSHQYRWLVTSRVSRPSGHFAFIVTQGLCWAGLLALLRPDLALGAAIFWCSLRIFLGAKNHLSIGSPLKSIWQVLLLPWKDVLYLGLWAAALSGNSVYWGNRRLSIDRQGRIIKPTTKRNP